MAISDVPGITPMDPAVVPVVLSVQPLNFGADWRAIDEGPGRVVYTNTQAPIDQPFTLRIAQVVRANVYAGTGIEPTAQCATKRGCDTVVELKWTAKVTDPSDPTFVQYLPCRVATTMWLPTNAEITAEYVLTNMLLPLLGAFASKSTDSDITTGLNELLHGVVEKR